MGGFLRHSVNCIYADILELAPLVHLEFSSCVEVKQIL